MELDFKSVKALSSPTRVKILHEVLEKERTPTQLSNSLGKSKSTISSHLSQLETSGLVEKDEEEGRKRVTYSPSRKAESIIKGREKKVKFSLTSSVLSLFAAVGLGAYSFAERFSLSSASYTTSAKDQSMEATALTADSAGSGGMGAEAARTGAETTLFTPDILLFIGAFFLLLSVGTFFYGWTMKKLGG